MFQVSRRLCGCSMRTLSFIIGIGFVFYGILCAFGTAMILDRVKLGSLGWNITVEDDGTIDVVSDQEGIDYITSEAQLGFTLFFSFLEVLAASVLIFGDVNYEPVFMIPILILIPVDLLIAWIWLFVSFSWVMLIFLAFVSVFFVYAWVCIFCFWKQLQLDWCRRLNKIVQFVVPE